MSDILSEAEKSKKFTKNQLVQIKWGLDNGLSDEQVGIYAKQKFNDRQMQEMRLGLEKGSSIEDVQSYAMTKYNDSQMTEIRWGLARLTKEQVEVFENGLSMEKAQELVASLHQENKEMTRDEIVM